MNVLSFFTNVESQTDLMDKKSSHAKCLQEAINVFIPVEYLSVKADLIH